MEKCAKLTAPSLCSTCDAANDGTGEMGEIFSLVDCGAAFNVTDLVCDGVCFKLLAGLGEYGEG